MFRNPHPLFIFDTFKNFCYLCVMLYGDTRPVPKRRPSPDQVVEIITTADKRLDDLLRQYLPKISHSKRKHLAKAIKLTAQGVLWLDINKQVDWVNWGIIQNFQRHYPDTFGVLWRASRACGEDYRKEAREAEAHRRAVKGWKEPVYYKGIECGTIRRFSDRLLELLLKADNPKYRDQGQQVNVQTNLLMKALEGSDCTSIIGNYQIPAGVESPTIARDNETPGVDAVEVIPPRAVPARIKR